MHGDTLAAVTLGALVATFSGVLANQVEALFKRRGRERAGALLFGEILSALAVIMDGAERSRHVGQAYGPVTRRMLHAARREINIYERNREQLLDLRDPDLRVDVHSFMVRMAMPIDGVIDSIGVSGDTEQAARDQAFEFINENLRALPALVARLGRIARHQFKQYDRIVRQEVRPAGGAQPPKPS